MNGMPENSGAHKNAFLLPKREGGVGALEGEIIEENQIDEETRKKLQDDLDYIRTQPKLAQLVFRNTRDDINLDSWSNTYGGESPSDVFSKTWPDWREQHQGALTEELLLSYITFAGLEKFREIQPDKKGLY